MIKYIEQPPTTQEILEENIKLGYKRIAESSLICYHCKKNKASQVILLTTTNPEEGATNGNMRILICGICPTCIMFTSERDKQEAAHIQFVNNILQ